jgi:methionyl aminopeptidase
MISIKSKKELAVMREGGKILAEIMEEIARQIAPGKSTLELDKLAEELVFARGGEPAFKGFGKETGNPFPATICASLNAEIVHGIPTAEKILEKGDLFKVDIGMKYKGFHTDMARTFLVGVSGRDEALPRLHDDRIKLIEITEKSFWAGIKKMKAGKMLSDYSKAVQKYVESQGFSVVKNLVGHGIGRKLHEDPQIPNYYNKKYQDFRLEAGMTLALEPMVNAGASETVLGADGWGFHSKDGSLTAHYENTIVITKKGVEVLTVIPSEA